MTTSPQTTQTRQRNPLDVEDYRRLGVRPNEHRLGVIRSAAARSASPLADRQLDRPNEKTVRQLSKVVASAYRLLDPRRRQNPAHRAYVGRIMPQTLGVAGRTKFAVRGQTLGDTQLMTDQQQTALVTETELFQGTVGSKGPFSELNGNFSLDPSAPNACDELWKNALQDDDLVAMTPAARKRRHVQRRMRSRWYAIIGVGVIVGAVLGIRTIRPPSDSASSLSNISPSDQSSNRKAKSKTVEPASQAKVMPADTLPAPVEKPIASEERRPTASNQNKTPYLSDPFATSSTPQQRVAADPMPRREVAHKATETIDRTEIGLRGRWVVTDELGENELGGESNPVSKDMGVSIRYQSGIPIESRMLEALETHLRRPLAGSTIKLSGVFEHQESNICSILISDSPDGLQQHVLIDGKPIVGRMFSPTPGQHQVEWQLRFSDVFSIDDLTENLVLSIEYAPPKDPANWQRVSVFSLASDRDQEQASDLKVAIVASSE